MSESLIDRIIRHEGFRQFIYMDTLGNPTIGFGHCLSTSELKDFPDGVTWDEAMKILEDDLDRDKENCVKEFPWLLGMDECRQDIIFEMSYQMGVGGVAQFKNMIAAIRDKDWQRASEEMLNSSWAKETPSRAQELANLMLKGESDV